MVDKAPQVIIIPIEADGAEGLPRVYEQWKDVETDADIEVTTKPSSKGNTVSLVRRNLPKQVHGQLIVADNRDLDADFVGPNMPTDVWLGNEVSALEELRGKLVKFHCRTLREPVFGILASVKALDTGEWDNAINVEFKIREITEATDKGLASIFGEILVADKVPEVPADVASDLKYDTYEPIWHLRPATESERRGKVNAWDNNPSNDVILYTNAPEGLKDHIVEIASWSGKPQGFPMVEVTADKTTLVLNDDGDIKRIDIDFLPLRASVHCGPTVSQVAYDMENGGTPIWVEPAPMSFFEETSLHDKVFEELWTGLPGLAIGYKIPPGEDGIIKDGIIDPKVHYHSLFDTSRRPDGYGVRSRLKANDLLPDGFYDKLYTHLWQTNDKVFAVFPTTEAEVDDRVRIAVSDDIQESFRKWAALDLRVRIAYLTKFHMRDPAYQIETITVFRRGVKP